MFKGVQSKNLPLVIELHLQQKENNENCVRKNFEENLSFENHREFLRRNSSQKKIFSMLDHDRFCVETQIDTIPLEDDSDASVESDASQLSTTST